MRDPIEYTFFCNRREMPVMKDTSDCWGCPLKTYPTPCPQYDYWHKKALRNDLGFITDIPEELIREPEEPKITE